jgi:hypothetical protein
MLPVFKTHCGEVMHFRVRKNVIQLIRIAYDADKKKGVNTVVGSVKLARPELTDELRRSLSPEEVAEFEAWVGTHHRAETLRDELAALTLADTMTRAERWFRRKGGSHAAQATAAEVVGQWQSLRRTLVKNGLLH